MSWVFEHVKSTYQHVATSSSSTSDFRTLIDERCVVPEPLVLARQGHAGAVVHDGTDRLLVVTMGRGETTDQRSGPRTYLSDVAALLLRTGEWRSVTTQSDATHGSPEARHNHSVVAHDNTLWLFGGSGNNGFLDDLWSLHLLPRARNGDNGESLFQWRRVMPGGRSADWPVARHAHSAVVVNGNMIVVGGHSGRQSMQPTYHGDVWAFDFASLRWTMLRVASGGSLLRRSWHNCVALDELRLCIAMGYRYADKRELYYNDFVLLDIDSKSSTCQPTTLTLTSSKTQRSSPTPAARNRASMLLVNQSTVLLVGGNSFDGRTDTFYDDAFVVDIDCDRHSVTFHTVNAVIGQKLPRAFGHAVAVVVDQQPAASCRFLLCGGEFERKRLDQMLLCRVRKFSD
jgi:hypothetical protein